MIHQLHGRLVSRRPNFVIIEVNGVGYGVHIPLSTYGRLEDASDEVTLLTYTHLTQDRLELYGFSTNAERELFHLLITVNGVGPRLAIGILSGIRPEELVSALERRDEARLTRVPGIGRKTAARLTTELSDRMKKLSVVRTDSAGPAVLREDLMSALTNLGYAEARAARVIEEAMKSGADEKFEALFRKALALLST